MECICDLIYFSRCSVAWKILTTLTFSGLIRNHNSCPSFDRKLRTKGINLETCDKQIIINKSQAYLLLHLCITSTYRERNNKTMGFIKTRQPQRCKWRNRQNDFISLAPLSKQAISSSPIRSGSLKDNYRLIRCPT